MTNKIDLNRPSESFKRMIDNEKDNIGSWVNFISLIFPDPKYKLPGRFASICATLLNTYLLFDDPQTRPGRESC